MHKSDRMHGICKHCDVLLHPLIERDRLPPKNTFDRVCNGRKTPVANRAKNRETGFDQRFRCAPRDLLLARILVRNCLELNRFSDSSADLLEDL
jgi:hypothetical protein